METTENFQGKLIEASRYEVIVEVKLVQQHFEYVSSSYANDVIAGGLAGG